jgi:hypothetical protein
LFIWVILLAMLAAAVGADVGQGGAPASAGQPSLLDQAAKESPVVFPRLTINPRRPKPIYPENTQITDRQTRLEHLPGFPLPVIDDPQAQRLYLLPCQLLEEVETIQAARPETQFRLSGRVCVYRGAYYLMLNRALLAVEPPTDAATMPADPAPASPPAATSAPSTAPDAASAEDILHRLLSHPVGRPVVPVIQPMPNQQGPSVAPALDQPLPHGPGRMVVDRLVRLTGPDENGWFMVAFESDNTQREPPLRVLPNTQLEQLEELGKARRAGNVFHISGEIKTYRGRQYVLLFSVTRNPDMDQF